MQIATHSYENINRDYTLAIEWVRSLGVHITSGRTKFYEQIIGRWSKNYRTASEEQANNIFPDFMSSIFEVMYFIDIYKSLLNVPTVQLKSIADKLQKGVNGPVNSVDESSESSTARNFIFEALVAAKFHNQERSMQAIFESNSDAGVKVGGTKFGSSASE